MIDSILQRLEKVRGKGPKYMACCPSHQDRTPSLAIQELPDGRVLMHCMAGCEVLDVLSAIGLEMGDLFPDGGLGQYKGWMQIINGQKDKTQQARDKATSYDKTLLMVSEATRNSGQRLTAKELKAERAAFERVRNATH